MTTIIGIKVSNRAAKALEVQKTLTELGCSIRTRIGLHNEIEGQCSNEGIILLEIPNNSHAREVEEKLCDIDGIELQQMVF